MESLTEFIRSNPDPRELKGALAVKMVQQNYSYYQVRDKYLSKINYTD